jgi:hypothetical protein
MLTSLTAYFHAQQGQHHLHVRPARPCRRTKHVKTTFYNRFTCLPPLYDPPQQGQHHLHVRPARPCRRTKHVKTTFYHISYTEFLTCGRTIFMWRSARPCRRTKHVKTTFYYSSSAYFPYMITINRGSNVKGLYYNPFTGSTIFMYGLPGHAGAPNL